ncbi:uncharacterized protein G6M90_00g026390 [Metarhizium brunneum]|uniref:Uncharacterized protein n=1 Tax=Metarhizium brunneum TaxID=500148 RepID=A0A7D5YZ33_9HYPO|nr:hypothetical protein G6M90_00g026390 [Metarhizium brunneum]
MPVSVMFSGTIGGSEVDVARVVGLAEVLEREVEKGSIFSILVSVDGVTVERGDEKLFPSAGSVVIGEDELAGVAICELPNCNTA